MLQHTFCHLPGIGPRTEQRFWDNGITSWQDYLALPTSRSNRQIQLSIEESLSQWQEQNPVFFANKLPSKLRWRLYEDFQSTCAFLDIETTGLGNFGDHVTTIALYDGTQLRCYVHGINLEEFPKDVQRYKVLVTYNGTTFDLPFLMRQFNMTFPQAHIDLRYVLRGMGYSGGLKKCEKMMNLDRGELQDLDGFAAVLLWQEYKRSKDPRTLETLLAYNVADTINLETLLILACQQKHRELPFSRPCQLPQKTTVVNPYHADPTTVEKIAFRSPRYAF